MAALLAMALGASLLRDHARRFFATADSPPAPACADAKAWLVAVRSGDDVRARLLAARLTPDGASLDPAPDYLEWMRAAGLSPRLLTADFGPLDSRRWADALLAEEILSKASMGDGSPAPEAVLAVILAQVSPSPEAPDPGPADNVAIWQAGIGNPRDLIRLFALAMGTAGNPVQAVALHAADGTILHWLCEVRAGAAVWTVDPATGFCGRGIDAVGLLGNPRLPDNPIPPEMRPGVAFTSCHLPAELADYRPRQRCLAVRLAAVSGGTAPRFPGDPRERIEQWRASGPSATPHFTYWRYPAEALLANPAPPSAPGMACFPSSR